MNSCREIYISLHVHARYVRHIQNHSHASLTVCLPSSPWGRSRWSLYVPASSMRINLVPRLKRAWERGCARISFPCITSFVSFCHCFSWYKYRRLCDRGGGKCETMKARPVGTYPPLPGLFFLVLATKRGDCGGDCGWSELIAPHFLTYTNIGPILHQYESDVKYIFPLCWESLVPRCEWRCVWPIGVLPAIRTTTPRNPSSFWGAGLKAWVSCPRFCRRTMWCTPYCEWWVPTKGRKCDMGSSSLVGEWVG